MILDMEPVRDGKDERRERAERDTSFGVLMIAIIVVVFLIACGTSFGIGYAVGHYYTPPDADKLPVQTAVLTPPPAVTTPSAPTMAAPSNNAPADKANPMTGISKPPAPTPASVVAKPQPKPVVAAPQPKPVLTHLTKAKPSAGQFAKSKPSPYTSAKHPPMRGTAFARNSNSSHQPDPFSHLLSNPNYGIDSSPTRHAMVQVAVLTRDEDASILIDALSRHGYSAAANRESDHRIHIRLGPFSTRTDASAMRDKLLNDGYNAVVQ